MFLKTLIKYLVLLLLLNIFLLGSGFILVSSGILNIYFNDIIVLSLLYSIINFLTIIIFLRGQSREADSQTMHTLLSVSFKFIIELILALIWFIVAKKTTFHSVLLFFVLYLAFTLISIWLILKTLKYRSLKNMY
jgi:hypothetical protein